VSAAAGQLPERLGDHGQGEIYEQVRDAAKAYAYLIRSLCPPGREQDLALTNLEQVVFWCSAGIARA